MKIFIRKSAIKDLKKIEINLRNSLHEAIQKLSEFPNLPNVKKLTNFEPAYRLRSGDYRILFDVIEDTVYIGRVLPRKDSYK